MALPTDYIKKVEETDAFLNKIIDKNQKNLARSIINLENKMLTYLEDITADSRGFIKTTKINFKNAQRIHRQVVDLFEKEYGPEATKVLKEFSAINDNLDEIYGMVVGVDDLALADIDSIVIDRLKNNSYNQYQALGLASQEKIATELYNQVVAGGSKQELLNTVSSILTGRLDKRGQPMTNYVELWANDTIMNFNNSINLAKADLVGITSFQYYGSIIATTRPFCAARAGKTFTEEQINSWTYSWKGKSGPAMTNRGGWNCRHHWVPVNPDWFDDEDNTDLLSVSNDEIPLTYFNENKLPEDFKRTVQNSYNSISIEKRRLLERYNQKVIVTDRLTSYKPELKRKKPRGWPKGSTWNNVDGVYMSIDGKKGEVIIAREARSRGIKKDWVVTNRGPAVMKHEFGHAYDFAMKEHLGLTERTSLSRDFADAYYLDTRAINPADRKQLQYFLQRNGAGQIESFAEAFWLTEYKPDIDIVTDVEKNFLKVFERSFPRVIEYVKNLGTKI